MPNTISVSPDGLIALTMSDQTDGSYEALPQSGHIWLIDSTGRVQTVLTEGENLSWATFSPDGSELLYVEGPSVDPQQILTGTLSYPWRLMLFRRYDGTSTELLRGDRGFLWGLSFSPNGRTIAYYRGDGENRLELYIFDRDVRQEKLLKLVQDGDGLYYAPYGPRPVWTPDGQGIFVLRVEQILPQEPLPRPEEITPQTVRVFAGSVSVVSIACGCEQRIARGFFPLLPAPLSLAASLDGQRLYLTGYDRTFSISATERVNLYEISLETGEQATLYDQGGIVVAPALSPDGERLVFTVVTPGRPPQADLYLAHLTSLAPPRKLTDDGRSGFGFWLSGEEIGFLKLTEGETLRGEIWVKNLSTNEERNLSALLAVQSSVPTLLSEVRAYQATLDQVQHQLRTVNESIATFFQRLDAVQTQSLELTHQITQRFDEVGKQLGVLSADMSAVKAQIAGVETEVKALSARPALSLWQVVFALLIAVIAIVVLIRRALHGLAQQLAFPPQ